MASMMERAVRDAWFDGAVRGPFFGKCDACGRVRDDDDRLILVARQRGHRDFECLDCFDRRQAR